VNEVVPAGRERVVHRTGHTIGVTTWDGAGPPLLLTHGAGLCAGIFEPVIPLLADRWSPLAIDLRGHGRSDPAAEPDEHGLPTQAADLLAVLDELGHGRVSVFGHSYGGSVALRAVLDHPARFDAVAVYEPAIGHPDDDLATLQERSLHFTDRILKRPDRWPDRQGMVDGLLAVRAFRELAPAFLDALVEHGSRIDERGQWRMRCDPATEAGLFRTSLSAVGGHGMQPELGALATTPEPFTLLSGDGSAFRLGLYEAVAALCGVPLTVVEGHHFGPFRSPAWFAELVTRHVPAPTGGDRP
jgi:pimeloyl-ACP methyl ester carboxylesterase